MELIKIENGKLPETVIQTLVNFERMAKQIKDQQEELKKGILEAMERNGILKIDNEYLTISYIGETDRETFDSKGFRAEYPELYDDFVKISTVKPSIGLKLKDR